MIRLLIGTNREGSNTGLVAAQVADIYKELGTQVEIIDLATLPKEIFERSAYQQKPSSFGKYVEQIKGASGLVVFVPEYNGSYPGVLKYFIDMLPFPESLEGCPSCFIGISAGPWGALRAVEHLQDVFMYRGAFIYPKRVFLPLINTLLTGDGKIVDAEIITRLKNQAAGFINFVNSIKIQSKKTQ